MDKVSLTNIKSYQSNLYPKQQKTRFGNNIQNDVFTRQNTVQTPYKIEQHVTKFSPENFVKKYADKNYLETAISNNPQIALLLAQQGLKVNITPENISKIIHSHLIPTMNYAKQIMKTSGIPFSDKDYQTMTQAALLHDIGKVLIPPEILNSKNKLTQKEKDIINLHDKLGAEILKSSDISPEVINIIKNHHDYQNKHIKNTLTQILIVADIYSALKEERPYKKAMTDDEAFAILFKKTENGECEKAFVNILKKSLSSKQQNTFLTTNKIYA